MSGVGGHKVGISATFKADFSEFQRSLARASELMGGYRRERQAEHFACDYCAGVSDGLSCVHCGAPRRAIAAVSTVEATTAADAQPVYLRPVEPQNRTVRG